MPQDHQVPPQFTNPWVSQEQLNDATSLHALSKSALRGTEPYLNRAALASSHLRQMTSQPGSFPNPTGLMPSVSNSSLSEIPYRSRPDLDFSNGMDARGIVLSQPIRGRQDSTNSAYHSTHSASSSVSSNHSFPYYNGGSIDSSATDYSDGNGYPQERAGGIRTSRPGNYINNANVPNQMMTTFSSKITSSTQKKHKCKVCDKRFTRPSSLQTHTYSHTGEKPFACEQEGCGRRFSVVSNLRRHKKVHQGKKHGE
jgi:uncharacterized Zn-finger protein